MGIGLEIGSAVAGLAGGLFKTGYDIWSNNRDFDYQEALQQEVFNREDNAVQRRMKDLQAAGLNPNLAAGSAAGAGSVVGRSNTPSLTGNPVGTALDNAAAVQQLRAQRTQNEILRNQEKESASNAMRAASNATYDTLIALTMMGLKPKVTYTHDGNLIVTADSQTRSLNGTPLGKELVWRMQNGQNSAALLQKDIDYYDTNRFFNYLGASTGALGNLGKFGGSLPRMRR